MTTFDQLLTIDELEANTSRLALDPRVTITNVGASRLGRPIEMISVGEGARDALIVGAPHPNEPAGAVTVERMICGLLDGSMDGRGYRWHFIKAIDPEGLKLNHGWLKQRTLSAYLENFFRPALHRQPETTFPLHGPDVQFDASTPENLAWQQAFALTRPCLHASLHHCDYGGVFYSLSRALPGALRGLEQAAANACVGINDLEDDVMDAEQWTPAVKRYPSVPELVAKAKASGATWAYPWTVGKMSPGYGEAHFGTFTLIAEVPMWDAVQLHDAAPSGMTHRQQQALLGVVASKARTIAVRHVGALMEAAVTPDELECLWAFERGLKMMPWVQAPEVAEPDMLPDDGKMLSRHDFEMKHTEQVLFVLRTYSLILRLTKLILDRDAGNPVALGAHREVLFALREELAAIEAHTTFVPVPLSVMTEFQMQSILTCADALAVV